MSARTLWCGSAFRTGMALPTQHSWLAMTSKPPQQTQSLDNELEAFAPQVDLPLDPGIKRAVLVLRSVGIETFESCEGGPGHAYPEPTVRFDGIYAEGFRALAVAMTYGLPVTAIRRIWAMQDGEPAGPWWEITFRPTGRPEEESGC